MNDMARLRWLKNGIILSLILFISSYFLIYKNVAFSDSTSVLILFKWDVSYLREFLSDIKNIIISSLVIGFILGLITSIRFRKKDSSLPSLKN
jgi:hypothetical protein